MLFVWAFIQNFLLPFLFTTGNFSIYFVKSSIMFKEILLLLLFLISIYYFFFKKGIQLVPLPLLVLGVFTLYCLVRFFGDLVLNNISISSNLRTLRMASFPFQIFTVGLVVALFFPNRSEKLIGFLVKGIGVLSIVGLILFFLPYERFWHDFVNLAEYNVQVKGDEISSVSEELGVSYSALGREFFQGIFPLRMIGTFGDPLAFGLASVVPILVLFFQKNKNLLTFFLLTSLLIALFLTFSRSAWLLLFISLSYILFVRRRYFFLIAGVFCLSLVVGIIKPLREFFISSVSSFSLGSVGDVEHAKGVIHFYTKALLNPGNILGSGIGQRVIPESGFGFLLEQFGIFALIFFILFLVFLFLYIPKNAGNLNDNFLVSKGLILGSFVILHFAEYPFSFVGYLPIWFLLGTATGAVFLNRMSSLKET